VHRHLDLWALALSYLAQEESELKFELTLVHNGDCQPNEDIAENYHNCAYTVVAMEEARLVGIDTAKDEMADQVDACPRRVQNHVVDMQTAVVELDEILIIHTRRCAQGQL